MKGFTEILNMNCSYAGTTCFNSYKLHWRRNVCFPTWKNSTSSKERLEFRKSAIPDRTTLYELVQLIKYFSNILVPLKPGAFFHICFQERAVTKDSTHLQKIKELINIA